VHPVDAASNDLKHGELVELATRWGRMLTRIQVDQDQRPGSVFVPMHWSDAIARTARADALANPALDPVSGQPEFKHTPVRVRPFRAAWYGFVISRERVEFSAPEWRVAIRGDGHWRQELAGLEPVDDWTAWAREHLGTDGDWLDFADPAHGRYRGARLLDGKLEACVFISPAADLPRSSWLNGLFQQDRLDAQARVSLLAGRPPRGQQDRGETVCSCFDVGLNTIVEAIRVQGLASPAMIGDVLQAGTNCGSCLPELTRILEQERAAGID
jgi:assimilatory nitrate reductase catalytic subunit